MWHTHTHTRETEANVVQETEKRESNLPPPTLRHKHMRARNRRTSRANETSKHPHRSCLKSHKGVLITRKGKSHTREVPHTSDASLRSARSSTCLARLRTERRTGETKKRGDFNLVCTHTHVHTRDEHACINIHTLQHSKICAIVVRHSQLWSSKLRLAAYSSSIKLKLTRNCGPVNRKTG